MAEFQISINPRPTTQVGNAIPNPTGTPGTPGKSVELKGGWGLSTNYVYRDLVYNNGQTYACKQAHTSSVPTEPGVGASWTTYWFAFAASPLNDSASSASSTYSSDKIDTLLSGKAASPHSHTGSDINTGTISASLIPEDAITQHVNAIDHNQLLNYDAEQHRVINNAGEGSTDLWSASKIVSMLSLRAPLHHSHSVSDIQTGTFADDLISQSSVTQHQAAIDHGSIAGLADNDHTAYPTNYIQSSLYTSPGNDYGVPPQNIITGANDGNGLLMLKRSATGTTLPTNTNVEIAPCYDGGTRIGGWIDSNGGRLGSGVHNVTSPSGNYWYWDGPLFVGANGFLAIEDAKAIRFYENYAQGDYYLGIKGKSALTGTFEYTMPDVLSNDADHDGSTLALQATGSGRGQTRWEIGRGSAFPTESLYTGRRFYHTGYKEEFVYDDGSDFGSPTQAVWLGTRVRQFAFGRQTASNGVTGAAALNFIGGATPSADDGGYHLPFDCMVIGASARTAGGNSVVADFQLKQGSTVIKILSHTEQASSFGDDPSEWVRMDASSEIAASAINCYMDWSSGAYGDPSCVWDYIRVIDA